MKGTQAHPHVHNKVEKSVIVSKNLMFAVFEM